MNEWMNEMFILLSYEGYFYEWEHDRTVNGNIDCRLHWNKMSKTIL